MKNSLKQFQKIKHKINSAICNFNMFHRSSRLLLALSGGKDSVALLWLLKDLNFSLEALHIDLGIENFSAESVAICKDHCKQANIPLHIVCAQEEKNLSVASIPAKYEGKQCNICGTLKRQIFNSFALRHKFDVLLVAHNMDDEAAMLFANNKKWNYAYLKKNYPLLSAQTGFITRAKPLVYCRENELKELAQKQNWELVKQNCPHSQKGSRLRYQEIFAQIEKIYPRYTEEYYFAFLKSYSQLNSLPKEKISLQPCHQCGELTPSTLCRLCSVTAEKWRAN